MSIFSINLKSIEAKYKSYGQNSCYKLCFNCISNQNVQEGTHIKCNKRKEGTILLEAQMIFLILKNS